MKMRRTALLAAVLALAMSRAGIALADEGTGSRAPVPAAAAVSAPARESARPEIRAVFVPRRMFAGDVKPFLYMARWKTEPEPALEISKITPPGAEGLEFVRGEEISSSELGAEGPFASKSLRYYFRASRSGPAKVGAVEMEFTDPANPESPVRVSSEPVKLTVLPRGMALVAPGLWAAAVAGILAGAWLWRRRKKQSALKAAEKIHNADVSAERELLDAVSKVKYLRIEGSLRDAYVGIRGPLERYLKVRYGWEASGGLPCPDPEVADLQKKTNEAIEKFIYAGQRAEGPDQDRIFTALEKRLRKIIQSKTGEGENP